MKTKKKKRRLIRKPLRIAAVFLFAAMMLMISRYPEEAVKIERQKSALAEASDEYYNAQAKNNRLNGELAKTNEREFIERSARRQFDYCWYGETIYEVINLDELREAYEMDVYRGE